MTGDASEIIKTQVLFAEKQVDHQKGCLWAIIQSAELGTPLRNFLRVSNHLISIITQLIYHNYHVSS